MCVAIWKPEGLAIEEEKLENCFLNNPDGAGFAYVENEELKVHKGLMTFEKFLEEYRPHKDKQCAIHFRIKTHGDLNEANTHPFMVTPRLAFIHNGIITVDRATREDMSDTWHFNERILKKLFAKNEGLLYKSEVLQELISAYIGYSKLVFLNAKNKVLIFGESRGEYSDDVWYSNASYKHRPVIKQSVPAVYSRRYLRQSSSENIQDVGYYEHGVWHEGTTITESPKFLASYRGLRLGDKVYLTRRIQGVKANAEGVREGYVGTIRACRGDATYTIEFKNKLYANIHWDDIEIYDPAEFKEQMKVLTPSQAKQQGVLTMHKYHENERVFVVQDYGIFKVGDKCKVMHPHSSAFPGFLWIAKLNDDPTTGLAPGGLVPPTAIKPMLVVMGATNV